MECQWCEKQDAILGQSTVFWELPDGTKAIEITETPTIICQTCGMKYQDDSTVKEIEDQLFLIDTGLLANSITFQQLMEQKRLLKRNYFDFS